MSRYLVVPPYLGPRLIPITTATHGHLTNTRAMVIPYFGYNCVLNRPTCHIQNFTCFIVICLVEILRQHFGDHANMSSVDFGILQVIFKVYWRSKCFFFIISKRIIQEADTRRQYTNEGYTYTSFLALSKCLNQVPMLFGFTIWFPHVVWDTMAMDMNISTPGDEASLSTIHPISTFPTPETTKDIVDRLLAWKIQEYCERKLIDGHI